MRTTRLIVWSIIAAIALFVAGTLAWRQFAPQGQVEAAADIGGPFTLTDQAGRTVTEADLNGSPTLLFFGYTHCPDVCPATLTNLTVAMQEIGDDAGKVQVFFVTVDPERDTQAVLTEYAQAFDPAFRLLTGTPEQVRQVVSAYHVYTEKVPGETGDYTMNHTASVYLLDAHARFVGTISYEEDMPTTVAKIERLIAKS